MLAGLSCSQEKSAVCSRFLKVLLKSEQIDLLLSICLNQKSMILQYKGSPCLKPMSGRKRKYMWKKLF